MTGANEGFGTRSKRADEQGGSELVPMWSMMLVLVGDLLLAANAVWIAASITDVGSWVAPAILVMGLPFAFWLVRLYRLDAESHAVQRVVQVVAGVAVLATLLSLAQVVQPGLGVSADFMALTSGALALMLSVWRLFVDRMEKRLVADLHRLLSKHRRWVALATYTMVAVAAYITAYLLRFELSVPAEHVDTLARTVTIAAMLRIVGFYVVGLSMERWRHVGPRDMIRLVMGTTIGSGLLFVVLGVFAPLPRVPRSVLLVDWMLVVLLVSGIWLTYRTVFEVFYRRVRQAGALMKRALIVGAGEAGSRLVREIQRDPMGYQPVGFVDDDPIKWATRLHGLEVLGATEELRTLATSVAAETIIIAIPSAEPSDLRRIVKACEQAGLPSKVLPSTEEVLSGRAGPEMLRDVRIEDLLGRDPVQLELPELQQEVAGKTVLITGAAGSIGSELTRQIAINGPAHLVLFEKNESELYFLDLDLRRAYPEIEITPIVGDILDRELLQQVFRDERPHLVFHAAAYKHVPLMETNARSAVRNNVFGTSLVAETAGETGCDRFVLISTDKAVTPVNVMGATKRAAELIVLDSARRYPETAFTAVRFGNVLGSRGSVVPLFERQLEAGHALTVTDPHVTRYFMTIPEAVQLVLQASRLDEARGRIAMLDMGEPVKIVDLARNLIRLKGLTEGVDAHITFCGLRPGEKMHEELASTDEVTSPTPVPKIRVIDTPLGRGAYQATLPAALQRVREGQSLPMDAPTRLLQELVPEYAASIAGPVAPANAATA